MSKQEHDSTDELLEQLRRSLAMENEQQNATAPAKVSTESDEDLAEFDSYTAQLLDRLRDEPPASPSGREIDMADEEPEGPEERPMAEQTPDMEEGADELTLDAQPLPEETPWEEPATDGKEAAFPEQLTLQSMPAMSSGQEDTADMADDADELVVDEPLPMEEPVFMEDEGEADEYGEPTAEPENETNPDHEADVDVDDGLIGYITEEVSPAEKPLAASDGAEEDKSVDQPEPEPVREGDMVLDEEDEIPAPAPAEPPVAAVEPEPAPEPAVQTPRPKQSPLDAMAARAMGNVQTPEGDVTHARTSRERPLSDDDVELLIDLGYETNLVHKVGSQRVEAVRYRRADDEKTRRRLRHVYGCIGQEYSNHDQDKQIKETYRRQGRGLVVRLFLCLLCALAILPTDLIPLLLIKTLEETDLVPIAGTYALLLGPALLVLAALTVWPMLQRGAKALLRFSPIPASLPVFLLVATLLYDMTMLPQGAKAVMLNFPTALSLVLLIVAELMRWQREKLSFEVVSARSRKIVMHPVQPRKKKVVRDGHIVKIINNEMGRGQWRVRPTEQVTGFFRRNGEGSMRYRRLSVLFACGLGAALAVGLCTLVVTGLLTHAATAVLLTLQMALPAAILICYAFPMLVVVKDLQKMGCTVVGQSAPEEYAGDKVLIFDDTEMFRAKSSTEITIKGSGDTKKYIRYAKRLFYTLGGTLRSITTSDLSRETYEERVEILKLYENGVQARIDGKVNILAGTSAFMVEHGIRVPGESAELLVRRNVESCILYLAFDGQLRLGYEIDYRISGRFEQMVQDLAAQGTAVAIDTCDPNISADLLTRSRRAGAAGVAVVKPARFEKHTESLICDSGVVATENARDVARATRSCDRLVAFDRRLGTIQGVALAAGVAASLVLALLDLPGQSIMFISAVLQLLWCIPPLALSRKELTDEQDDPRTGRDRRETKIGE